ncbi:MAG: glycyl-radical enzyme activating protein [Clostridia bacterium]|nr:glycyl-radical enzyme activating protein [Clostridia bacterium]
MNKAKVIEIKRFAVHDGDGLRTTVFLKGCPLKCVWCHNPESIDFKPQVAYYENKCIDCGECVSVCPSGAHKIIPKGHIFERDLCVACGKCEKACLGEALKFYGKEMTVDELLPILLEDKDFYETSGGGVTLSGGECLCQADFCAELLKKLKEAGINTAVDTCGYVPKESIDKVLPYTDTFLYDIKAIDENVHMKCTGKSNRLILENIKYIDSLNKSIEVRIALTTNTEDASNGEFSVFFGLSSLKGE